MTSTPSDEPLVPGEGTPPPPPAAADSGYQTPQPAYGATPPPAYGATPPPAYGANPPGGYAPPPAYGAPQATGYGAAGAGALLSDADQRMWATLAHIGGIVFSFIAPLVVWLIFRERGRFVEEQAKEALNFQITIAIAYLVSGILMVVLIGAFLLPLVGLLSLVLGIIAAIAANKGEAYRYPMTLRLVK